MIEIAVLYPNKTGARFDYDYYVNKHLPFLAEKFRRAVKGISVKKGIGGVQPETAPKYLYICQILFESPEAFYAAFNACADDLLKDIPNYTNIEPVIQMNELTIQG